MTRQAQASALFPFGSNVWERVLPNITGDIYFVDSGHGSTGDGTSHGLTPEFPFATMNFANGQCTANHGDAVIVAPRHVETVIDAAGFAADVAGVTYYCPILTPRSQKAQINFTTAVGADLDIDAQFVSFVNFLFTGGIDALTGPIDINAADCALIGCETRDVTGQATDFIVTDVNADRLLIRGWTHRGAAGAGAATAITIVGGDDITIEDWWIDGNFSVACIENVTTAAVNLTVGGGSRVNYGRTRNAADVIFTAVATTTGNVGPNIMARLQDNAANITEAFVGADMQFFPPIGIVNLDGESAFRNADGSTMTNITASTDA